MPEDTPEPLVDRHWTVSVYVVSDGKVALRLHQKLGILLPPGGHIEPGETPDDAGIRETREETGLDVMLVGVDQQVSGLPPHPFELPAQLVRPLGIQLTPLAFEHQHFDILYAARPIGNATLAEPFRWYTPLEAADHGAPPDVIAFATVATARVADD